MFTSNRWTEGTTNLCTYAVRRHCTSPYLQCKAIRMPHKHEQIGRFQTSPNKMLTRLLDLGLTPDRSLPFSYSGMTHKQKQEKVFNSLGPKLIYYADFRV